MKTIGWILVSVGMLTLILVSVFCIFADYGFNNQILANWTLAVKASTIQQKSDYIDKFVESVREAKLDGRYDALWLKTPDNSFDENFKALLSLQTRLHDIKTMDVDSFAYQTAIQQITAQEQGGAAPMLGVIGGVWWQSNFYALWNPLLILLWVLLIVGLPFLGAFLILNTNDF